MTPGNMRKAGELLRGHSWTDEKLALVIESLGYAIPFLEAARGFDHTLFVLHRNSLLDYQKARKRDR